jgi:hypothetical protein
MWNVTLKLALVITCTALMACGKSGSSSSTPASTPAPTNPSYVNPQVELQGMGTWQNIGGQNYFIPANNDPNWAPYQNGSWSYDEDQGWSWNSNDRWGNITDHYGIWRHHNQYGWIWLQFTDMHYAPHTVTWFDNGNYIGWYPYCAELAPVYRLYGSSYGFNDGYWDVQRTVLAVNTPGFSFHLGFTMVDRSEATAPNLFSFLVHDRTLIRENAWEAHQGDNFRRVGRFPGGDREHSFDFVQRSAPNFQAPVGRAARVQLKDGGLIFRPPHADRRHDNGNPGDGQHRDHQVQPQQPTPNSSNERHHKSPLPQQPATPDQPKIQQAPNVDADASGKRDQRNDRKSFQSKEDVKPTTQQDFGQNSDQRPKRRGSDDQPSSNQSGFQPQVQQPQPNTDDSTGRRNR